MTAPPAGFSLMTLPKQRILLIGAGHMGQALLHRWCDSGSYDVMTLDQHEPTVTRLRTEGYNIHTRWQSEFDLAEIVVLAVRPQEMSELAKQLTKQKLRLEGKRPLLISIAAGLPLQQLVALFGENFPMIRAMPNLGAQFGASMTALSTTSDLQEEHRLWAAALFDEVGVTCWLEESKLSSFTAACGSGPGLIFALAAATEAWLCQQGYDAKSARRLVQQTLAGSAAALEHIDSSSAELAEAVASPGGTTEAGLNKLRGDRTLEAWQQALTAAADRADEIAKNQT